LPAGAFDQPYSQTILDTGGTGTSTFSAVGPLPIGLIFSSAGVLSGTPTRPGSYTFTVTATDALGASGSKTFTLVIKAGLTPGSPLAHQSTWLQSNHRRDLRIAAI